MLRSTVTSIFLTAIHFLPITFGMSITNVTGIDARISRSDRGCSNDPCGINAVCREIYGRPICSCPPGCSGNPFINCHRDECLDTNECPAYYVCRNGRCINPCDGACAANAICFVQNHEPVCHCPKGYNGDPTLNCREMDRFEEICQPSPCGSNTTCKVQNDEPMCSCLPGFVGSPSSGCRHECECDNDCSESQMCTNYKCIPACKQCGEQALCLRTNNHRAVCTCPKGYRGSPYLECRPECYSDTDCSDDRLACINGTCKSTCKGGCDGDSECQKITILQCRKVISKINDHCNPNPCGENTECSANRNIKDRGRPVCTCLPGYTKMTSTGCARECLSNDDCENNQACIEYSCVHRWIYMS